MTTANCERAIALAGELVGQPIPRGVPKHGGHRFKRSFAIGDPQASRQRFFAVLDANELIGADGLLRPEVSLLSIGDHFDYPKAPVAKAGFEGLAILRWLAEHPSDQVPILVGNHDLARVIELSDFTDETFEDARALATRIDEASDDERSRLSDDFSRLYTRVPTRMIVTRDFSAFLEAQQSLLIRLLLAGRVRLAAEARLGGDRSAVATHAGVTTRELGLLGLSEGSNASEIASALNRFLDTAVGQIQAAWKESGVRGNPLDLAPLHVAGTRGAEGGGLLYHRPADPDRDGADAGWELNTERPRRFDPRTLPDGLTQIVGHTTHRKARRELARWTRTGSDRNAYGKIRTLTSAAGEVAYELGRAAPTDGAQVFMIDGHLVEADPLAYELFEVEQWIAKASTPSDVAHS